MSLPILSHLTYTPVPTLPPLTKEQALLLHIPEEEIKGGQIIC